MKHYRYCPYCKVELEENEIAGLSRRYCKGCGWINYLNPIPAIACVVFDEEKKILLVKRGVEPQIGKWALPAGFMELKENPEETALRELEEETGLKGEIIKLIGVYAQPSQQYDTVLSIGYLIKVIGGELRAGDDALDAKYLALRSVSDIPFESHRYMLSQLENV